MWSHWSIMTPASLSYPARCSNSCLIISLIEATFIILNCRHSNIWMSTEKKSVYLPLWIGVLCVWSLSPVSSAAKFLSCILLAYWFWLYLWEHKPQFNISITANVILFLSLSLAGHRSKGWEWSAPVLNNFLLHTGCSSQNDNFTLKSSGTVFLPYGLFWYYYNNFSNNKYNSLSYFAVLSLILTTNSPG